MYNREASAAGGPDAGGAPIRSDGNSGVKKGWNYFRGTAPINKNEIGHDIISPAKHLKIIIEGGNNIHKIYKHDNKLYNKIYYSIQENKKLTDKYNYIELTGARQSEILQRLKYNTIREIQRTEKTQSAIIL